MKEIERKYLVDKTLWKSIEKGSPKTIKQGYLSKSIESTVRVRIKGTKGYLTIKGKTEGISRDEYEYEIPLDEAQEMLKKFCPKFIDKDRYEINIKGHVWEVDVFAGNLEGLILAEIELQDESESFHLPDWVTEDVSEDANYYNAVLIEKC